MQKNLLQEKREGVATNKEYAFCLRCGRKLKNVEARKIGYGIVCLKKVDIDHDRKRLFTVKRK